MSNSRPETGHWQKLALSSLACEKAAIDENWTEFSQLCDRRSEELDCIGKEGQQPPDGVLDLILDADRRTRTRLEKSMKRAAMELRKYAKFREINRRIS